MKGENEKAFQILEMMEDKTTAQYLILLAEYYFNENDFDACVDTIGEFKKLEPQNPIIYQMLALVEEEKNNMHCAHKYWGKFYSLKQDTELSLSEYMLAHNLNPKDAEIINEIIRINENLGNNSSLMEFYEKLIVINPNDTLALEKLGDFYFNMYEFRNAAEYYEKFVEKNKNKYEILLKLGKCHEKLKNEALAKEYYQNYLSKAPLTPENEALKQKLSSLSDENMAEDEGFLEKILGFFAKK